MSTLLEDTPMETHDLQIDVDDYLDNCGGKDVLTFTWVSDLPSERMAAARAYAEGLRERFKGLTNPPSVEQHNHEVWVRKGEA